MQVGPAIESIPEIDSDVLLKQYAARPITFLQEYLAEHGTAATRFFIREHHTYPFLTDLFGEWLERAESASTSQAASALVNIAREIVGNSTLNSLVDLLQDPFIGLQSVAGSVDNEVVAGLLGDLHLSVLARKVRAFKDAIRHADLLSILSADPGYSVADAPPSNYDEFLVELKDAGIIIPPVSKEGRKPETASFADQIAAKQKPVKKEAPPKLVKPKPRLAIPKPSTVEAMLSPDAQAKIVTKIFRDDAEDYGRSMELINKAKDWKQASIYLDALFMRRKVDPYSKTAIRLTDAVYARFNSSK